MAMKIADVCTNVKWKKFAKTPMNWESGFPFSATALKISAFEKANMIAMPPIENPSILGTVSNAVCAQGLILFSEAVQNGLAIHVRTPAKYKYGDVSKARLPPYSLQ
jgi:hypothetical protein